MSPDHDGTGVKIIFHMKINRTNKNYDRVEKYFSLWDIQNQKASIVVMRQE